MHVHVCGVGENAIVIVAGANLLLEASEVHEAQALVGGAKVLICQMEIAPKTTLAALKMARRHGGILETCRGVVLHGF